MRLLEPRSRTPRIRVLLGGHWVIGFTILVGVAAAHSGAGQLHVFAALLLAFQAVCGFRSYQGLRRLVVSIELPARTSAGSSGRALVRIENRRRRLSACSLEVELILEDGGIVVAAPAFVDRVGPGETVVAPLPLRIARRGVARVVEVRVSSAYPAHLFRRTLRFPVGEEILAAPQPVPVVVPSRAAAERLASRAPRPSAGGDEFRGVRPWREGESLRTIHPRTSARRGAPVVREDEARGRAPWTVVVDARGLEGEPLEESLRVAAALARGACREGRRCSMRLPGYAAPIDLESARDLGEVLDALARHVEPAPAPPAPPAVGHVLLVGPRATAPAGALAVDRPSSGRIDHPSPALAERPA